MSVHGPKPKSLAERFERKVRRLAGEDACWEWVGAKNEAGYGQIYSGYPGRRLYAHRVAWEMANKPIPAGMQVRHRCDNPRCVRPSHLELGTDAENRRDMAARNRGCRSRSGMPRGVHRNHLRWSARICVGGREVYLGTFDTVEQAAEVARRERERLYGPAQCDGEGEAAA